MSYQSLSGSSSMIRSSGKSRLSGTAGMAYPRAASLSGISSKMQMSRSSVGGSSGSMMGYSLRSGFGSGISSGFSSGFSSGMGGGSSFAFSGSSGGLNEKQTMQDLNVRLASYLERVHSLEVSNKQLELKIKEYYSSQSPSASRDTNQYYKTIANLHSMIIGGTIENAQIILQIDNAKLTADDFSIKYNSELCIRQGVESDIQGLRRVLDELTMTKSDLEMQIEGLKEEMIYIRKNHEEELKMLRNQLGGTVTVDIDAGPKVDLVKMLTEMRQQYEAMTLKNQREAEAWFKQQVEIKTEQVVVGNQAMDQHKAQMSELRRTYQSLQMDLQSLISMNASLEGNIQETDCRYDAQLNQFQMRASMLEGELMQIRSGMQQQAEEYSVLLNIKVKLEIEIATYRRLLEGEARSSSSSSSSSTISTNVNTQYQTTTVDSSKITKVVEVQKIEPTVKLRKKTVTLVEEVVDGRVVSTKMQEVLEDD